MLGPLVDHSNTATPIFSSGMLCLKIIWLQRKRENGTIMYQALSLICNNTQLQWRRVCSKYDRISEASTKVIIVNKN